MAQATQTAPPTDWVAIEKVRTGQKFILYAILANIVMLFVLFSAQAATGGSGSAEGTLAGILLLRAVVGIAATVMAIVGLLRVASGLKYSAAVQVLVVLLLFVPLVSLLTLLYVNEKATAALRQAGYRVGLLGATGTPVVSGATHATSVQVTPGWHADPTGRHQMRYWNASGWTDHVSDDGVTALDPLGPPGVAASATVVQESGQA